MWPIGERFRFLLDRIQDQLLVLLLLVLSRAYRKLHNYSPCISTEEEMISLVATGLKINIAF